LLKALLFVHIMLGMSGQLALLLLTLSPTPWPCVQALLLVLGSITASLPIISFAFLGVIGCWLGAVRS
jgi:hypothetical protein